MARLESLGGAVACVALTLLVRCHPTAGAPFPGGTEKVAAEHAQVRTLNDGYARTRSHVLVREVEVPTRAALDYAAYHANFMIADPPPDALPPEGQAPDTSRPFGGLIDKATLTSDVNRTPLTDGERRRPVAFAPAVSYLESHHVVGAVALEEVATKVRGESWGLPSTPGVSSQTPAEAFIHAPSGAPAEIWVKIEFSPWFTPFKDLPDQDGDGFAELYGRVRADHAPEAAIEAWKGEYSGRALDARGLKTWANELSSYWYPSFNTDLVTPGAVWPDEHTEGDIKQELGGRVFVAPAIVLRGKPEGKATYEVFVVKTPPAPGEDAARPPESGPLSLPPTRPTPDPAPVVAAVSQELTKHGGAWSAWASELSPFHADIKKRLSAPPRDAKALPGADGFLFYRSSLEFVVGGDLESQPPGKNPAPIIVEFKKMLDAHGVDFLFVPVPTKPEIFPDEVSPAGKEWVGKVTNPFIRKLALSLSRQGVEVVDLLTPFLAAREKGGAPGEEPLYQRQDTHWTDRGLRLAAEILTKRIERYPWYASLARHSQRFGTKDTTFTRFGDLHSRLPEAKKRGYQPETLAAKQVLRADGNPYEDEAESPIVVLGDSFTGVYELTDAEHAGLSAHMARGISYPIDLVMSYGGGPNVRQKLMRRGAAALDAKKLVVWVMTARDLYKYFEAWEPLEKNDPGKSPEGK
jgi:hypothetical protein